MRDLDGPFVAVRTIVSPVHCFLFIKYETEGVPLSLEVKWNRFYPAEMKFVLGRGILWVVEQLAVGQEVFETAEDVLRTLPAGPLAAVGRAILTEIADWQAAAMKAPIPAVKQ